jgi:beta-galactosidase
MVDRIRAAAGVVAPTGAGEDVEVVRRTGPDASYLFVINHGATGLELPVAGHELVTDTPGTVLTVPAGSVRIVREDQR